MKHISWSFFAKLVDCIQPLTIFAKHFILGVPQVYEYVSNNTKRNLCELLFIWQKIRTVISASFFHFKIQFHLQIIILRWDINFKLIHPCSWMHKIIISNYLPVQTHHNSYEPRFSNFFSESNGIQSKYTVLS